MDAKTYATIIQSVCARIGMEKPNDTITRNVIAHCRKLNIKKVQQMYPDRNEFLLAIVKSYMDVFKKEPDFDYNQYLQNSRKIEKTNVDTTWLQSNMPVDASKSMSIYFDSRLRGIYNNGSNPIVNFIFSIVPKNTQTTFGDGNIQVRVLPSQITYFKLGSLRIPYTNTLRTNNYANEITLSFMALQSNGILSSEQTYHFVFKYTIINDTFVELIPVNEFCKFCPPLRHIDDLTLRFSDPIVPITFATDRMIAASLNYLSTDGRITFAAAHGLTTGDVVVVQGLETLNDSINTPILTQIHNPRGLLITVINPTIIAIGIDFTAIVSPDTSSKPLVIFYSRTFRFPMEIGYQDISELN